MFLVVVWATAGGAVDRFQAAAAVLDSADNADDEQSSVGLRQILLSHFGVTLGLIALITIVASALAGWVAGQNGFSSLGTITLIAAGAATVAGVLFLKSPDTQAD